MKRLLFLVPIIVLTLLLFVTLCPSALAFVSTGDGGWSWQLPQPQGNDLFDVSFADGLNGWAVGLQGTILHTADGGLTWEGQPSGVTCGLKGVSFPDATHGWAVGYDNSILATTDGGAHWDVQDPRGGWDVSFADASHGCVARGTEILSTSDGGAHWTASPYSVSGVSYPSAGSAFAVGGGVVLKSSDGGASWSQHPVPEVLDLTGVCFADVSRGWAVGYRYEGDQPVAVIVATDDGGDTWVVVQDDVAGYLSAVSFSDSQHGSAAGTNASGDAITLTTSDGGSTWTLHTVSAYRTGDTRTSGFSGVAMAESSRICAVGHAGIYVSSNGGTSWSQAGMNGPGHALTAVTCTDLNHAWAVGWAGTILATTDGGATWVDQDSGTTDDLTGVSFPDATHGWAVSAQGSVLATSDGGSSWSLQGSGLGSPLRAVTFVDALHGWAVGGDTSIWGLSWGFMRATDDGGAHWSNTDVYPPLYAVSFADANNGLAVGGAIYRTTDGGVHWVASSDPDATGVWYGVSYLDTTHAWAVGTGGMIVSRDRGQHWGGQIPLGSTAALRGVSFTDALHGCAVGDDGRAFSTKDGGVTWVQANPGTVEGLSGVALAGASHGWAVGGNTIQDFDPRPEVILATSTGGFGHAPVTKVSTKSLWQNGGSAHAATWKLVATPDPSVASVGRTEYTFDLGGWTTGTVVTLPAPVDHSGDGYYSFVFRSVGDDGAVEAYKRADVGVDTRRPTTKAPSSATARRGRTATLKYKVLDTAPNGGTATVVIRVKNRAGRVVKTLKVGVKPVNPATVLVAKFKVPRTWKAGTYRFFVYAKDTAGNTQAKVASNKLIVK